MCDFIIYPPCTVCFKNACMVINANHCIEYHACVLVRCKKDSHQYHLCRYYYLYCTMHIQKTNFKAEEHVEPTENLKLYRSDDTLYFSQVYLGCQIYTSPLGMDCLLHYVCCPGTM